MVRMSYSPYGNRTAIPKLKRKTIRLVFINRSMSLKTWKDSNFCHPMSRNNNVVQRLQSVAKSSRNKMKISFSIDERVFTISSKCFLTRADFSSSTDWTISFRILKREEKVNVFLLSNNDLPLEFYWQATAKQRQNGSEFILRNSIETYMNETHKIFRNFYHVQIDRMIILFSIRTQLNRKKERFFFLSRLLFFYRMEWNADRSALGVDCWWIAEKNRQIDQDRK